MNTTEYLQTWSDSYKNDMISNIMPFWMKYGWDLQERRCLYLRRP